MIEARSGRPTAMLVDDESMVRRLMRTMLFDLECQVVEEASNAGDALDKYRAQRTDIVFIDINMEGMDGLTLLGKLVEFDPHAFCVIVSADSTAEKVQRAVAGGAQGFIVKPFTARRFQDILDKHRQSRAAAPSAG